MKSAGPILGLLILFAPSSYGAPGGILWGRREGSGRATVQGSLHPGPEREKQDYGRCSDRQTGGIPDPDLPPGEYQVEATAVGYKNDLHASVKVDGEQAVSLNFALQKGTVRWADLSIHEGQVLLPDGPGNSCCFSGA